MENIVMFIQVFSATLSVGLLIYLISDEWNKWGEKMQEKEFDVEDILDNIFNAKCKECHFKKDCDSYYIEKGTSFCLFIMDGIENEERK